MKYLCTISIHIILQYIALHSNIIRNMVLTHIVLTLAHGLMLCNLRVTAGLQADAGKFFLFMLGLFAQSLAMSGIVYSVAAGVGALSAGQIVLNMVILFSMVSCSTCTCS